MQTSYKNLPIVLYNHSNNSFEESALKTIEYKNSPDELTVLQYDDLKENHRYRVQIQYHTMASNNEKRRAIIINSNNYEFEFTHKVTFL